MKRALIFDSGVGGLSVFDAIVAAGLPLEIDYVADNAWLPYGDKPDAAIRRRVPLVLDVLCGQLKPDIVVMACNTASTIALDAARVVIETPIVGVVPPIKPAAEMSRTGVIGLLATPATVARPYTNDLIARFAADKTIIRHGSTLLVAAAEAKLAGEPVDGGAITDAINQMFGASGGSQIDVVALSCTHFPLLKAELAAAGPPNCTWLDSGEAIARRVASVLALEPGVSRPRRAYFTAPPGRVASAFVARGFTGCETLGGDFLVSASAT